MTDFWIRHYDLKNDKPGEGWARVVLTSDGFFSTVSDWGNYAFWWGSPGCEFRRFVIGLVGNTSYVVSKLGHHPWEYDGEKSCRAIKEAILELRRRGDWDAERAREEWNLLQDCEEVDTIAAFTRWHDETKLYEPHEYYLTSPPGQLIAFCELVLPRLAKVLEEELAKEAGDEHR